MSSRTLLTLATALVAVPGAAIAAAEPGEPLVQVGAVDAEEIDCEQLLDAPGGEEAGEGDADDTTGDADAFEARDVPEECPESADEVVDGEEAAEDEDERVGDAGTEDDLDADEDAEELESRNTDEPDDAEGAEQAEEADAHGAIVSTVAHCAPRGQELLDGFDLPNHGAYVSAAAKGETLEVGDGYDLGTLAGAERLCEDLDAARGDAEDAEADAGGESSQVEPSGVEEPDPDRSGPTTGPATGEQQRGESGPPAHAGKAGGGNGKGSPNAPGRNR